MKYMHGSTEARKVFLENQKLFCDSVILWFRVGFYEGR